MSTVGEKGSLPRPYTLGTFQKRLTQFEDYIRNITYQEEEATPEERRQMITENLRYDQFCDSIRALFGTDIRSQDLKAIYRKISTNPDARVDWSELFGYFQSESEDQEITVGEDVNVFTISARVRVGEAAGDRKRRDVVQSLRHIPQLDSVLSASQKGAVSVWNNKLRLQGCTDINESSWVTGCDYLPSIRRVAVTTERSINIWDNRAKGKNQQVFSIKPIEHSPQCMTWVPLSHTPHEDTILFGDDQGFVNALTVTSKDLTMKNSKGDKRFAENFTIEPSKLTNPVKRKRFHDDWVLKIRYYPDLRCFASCSPSQTKSFVLEDIDKHFGDETKENKDRPRHSKDEENVIKYMKVPKGVNAFDFCPKANIIATGGVDKIIRVWHPHIFTRPTGKLIGHLFTIVDIVCNNKDQHIISLSTARVFRVWDIHTLTCLQVFTDNEDRPGEKRIYGMVFDNKHDRLVTGSSVLDAWPLTRAVQDTMQVPHTHDRPVSQMRYNQELNHMVTVCTESTLKAWEAESGRLVYQIPEAHGSNIEVTAIAIDKSGYRLATGAHDGSLKIWDFGSGQEIKWKTGKGEDQDYSVTGLQYCMVDGERCIIGAGWNNRLRIFLDSNDNYDLPVLRDFTDIQYLSRETTLSPAPSLPRATPLPKIGETPVRGSAQITSIFTKEYVLSTNEISCITALLPNILVTGCTNGNLILWDIQKATVDKVLRLPDPPPTEGRTSANRLRRKQVQERAVSAVRVLVHRVRRPDPAYFANLGSMSRRHSQPDDPDAADENGNSKPGSRASHQHHQSRAASQAANENPTETRQQGQDGPPPHQELINTVAEVNENNQNPENTEKQVRLPEVQVNDLKEQTDEVDATPDPDAHMIVESYEPVIVACHHDSFIRFWSLQGELLREVTAMTRRQGSPVTALCHDKDCNLMVTGDQKGYLTLWDIASFLEKPQSEKQELIKQVVCWRAHLTKVTELEYISNLKAIISGSTDGSARVWWGKKGRFVGFYGQHRSFNFPASEDTSAAPILPYDINEGPLAPVKTKSARQKMRSNKYEYPLIFKQDRWKPFRRSAVIMEEPRPSPRYEEVDKKFFAALVKPRAYNDHLESSATGLMRQGAVFRALPVYTVRTPPRPSTPDISYASQEEDQDNLLLLTSYNQQQQQRQDKVQKPASKSSSETKVKSPKKNYASSFPTQQTGRTSGASNYPGSPRKR